MKDASDRCRGCHGSMRELKKNGRPKHPIHEAMFKVPLVEFECTDCHRNIDLWKRNPNKATFRINRFQCMKCHEATREQAKKLGRGQGLKVPGTMLLSNHGLDRRSGRQWIKSHNRVVRREGVKNCRRCHKLDSELDFCRDCHRHPRKWIGQHFKVARKLGLETCLLCHEQTSQLRSCQECHAKLLMVNRVSTVVPRFKGARQVQAYCLGCHGNRKIQDFLAVLEKWAFVDGKTFSRSVHKNVPCTGCHQDFLVGAHPENVPKDFRRRAGLACAACHKKQASKYRQSIHAKLAVGARSGRIAGRAVKAAVCADCHGSHDIQSQGREPFKTSFRLSGAKVCGRCHADRYESFSDYYHGKGYKNRAYDAPSCWDCHSNHRIVKAADPSSPIARHNLPRTCGKCHDHPIGIHNSYARLIHNRRALFERNPIVRLIRTFFPDRNVKPVELLRLYDLKE